MNIFSLFAYTFSHFAVDYVCILTVLDPFGLKSELLGGVQNYALFVILYNILAFGLQMFFGYFCDKHKNFPAGAFGCILVMLGAFLSENTFETGALLWFSVIFVGIGNAFFHVGGGIESLLNSKGKLCRSGVFVSSGAMGVALAVYSASKTKNGGILITALMLICAAACFIAHKKSKIEEKCNFKDIASEKLGIWIVLGLTLLSVAIRSFGGNAISAEWKTTAELGLVFAFGAFFGKFIGGFAADFFGARRIGVITLLLSLPFLILGNNNMFISILGIILFNMTMPITLGICAEKLPENPGLAFGLTTAALLLGAAPSFFMVLSQKNYLLIPAVIISAFSIFISAKNKGGVKNDAS